MLNAKTLSDARSWAATEFWHGSFAWSGPGAERGERARRRAVDMVVVTLALLLPWSTAAASGLAIGAVIAFLFTLQARPLWTAINRPAGLLPIALFLLAAIGTLWAIDIPWRDRLHGVDQVVKLLLIPLLFYQYRESRHGKLVFAAFIASNVVLMIYSFVVFASPTLAITMKIDQPGVPVKNYIDQSQAFALCAVWLAGLAIEAFIRNRKPWAILFIVIAAAFLTNLAFINVARTAFLYLPVMLLMLMARYLSGRKLVAALLACAVIGLGIGLASPNLRLKVSKIFTEYDAYETNVATDANVSVAARLEYWQKSIKFFQSSPLWGHGTGSTKTMFERDAVGKTGLSAIVIGNPHNQTLAVAVQWGLIGCFALYAMWIVHLLLFRHAGFVGWVGALAVMQNIVSSLFNSHLFDFYQGWIYVLAVGIAGGMTCRRETNTETARTPVSLTASAT